ncbi:MAG: (Fe-S)-binding protein [Thermoproteota archaeon]
MAAYGFAEFKRAMPGYDCGLCGNATCATFARRLLLGVNSFTDCPILQREGYSENKGRMEEMLKKGVVHSSPSIITVPGFKTRYAHPNYFEERLEKLPTRFLDYDTARYLISLLWKPGKINGDGVEVIDTFFGNMRFLVTTGGRIAVNIGEHRTEDRELVSILYKVLWGSVDLLRKADYAPGTGVLSWSTWEDAA